MQAMIAEREQHAAWALPLTGEELDALRAAWPGGSVRGLARLLEGILRVRDLALDLQ